MATKIIDGAFTLEIKLVVVAFDHNECEIDDCSVMTKLHIFSPKVAELTSVVCRQGKRACVINLSGIVKLDVIQRRLISLLLADELSWTSPHVEELEMSAGQLCNLQSRLTHVLPRTAVCG